MRALLDDLAGFGTEITLLYRVRRYEDAVFRDAGVGADHLHAEEFAW